ncbi:hypothetical protein BGZ63DRAFT_98142 [Mariannaea sp. PMI_226]|nr:hypothetical protein BGZ63DRAFT_98142 [Mariannaea sp. PMI_226]
MSSGRDEPSIPSAELRLRTDFNPALDASDAPVSPKPPNFVSKHNPIFQTDSQQVLSNMPVPNANSMPINPLPNASPSIRESIMETADIDIEAEFRAMEECHDEDIANFDSRDLDTVESHAPENANVEETAVVPVSDSQLAGKFQRQREQEAIYKCLV